jgi:signal transduction histidine kinase
MDRADMRRAFDRFWRGDNATTSETGGSGLGLAIVRELAKGMKGDASVSQREGGGLVFEVRLPAAREGSGAA